MVSKSFMLFIIGLLVGGSTVYFVTSFDYNVEITDLQSKILRGQSLTEKYDTLSEDYDQLLSQYNDLEASYEELLEQYELVVASNEYVEEELVTRTFTFDRYGVARTTLNVREKATVSGTYSRSPTGEATAFSIQITAESTMK